MLMQNSFPNSSSKFYELYQALISAPGKMRILYQFEYGQMHGTTATLQQPQHDWQLGRKCSSRSRSKLSPA